MSWFRNRNNGYSKDYVCELLDKISDLQITLGERDREIGELLEKSWKNENEIADLQLKLEEKEKGNAGNRGDIDELRSERDALVQERDRLVRQIEGTPGFTSVEGLLIDAKGLIQKAKKERTVTQKVATQRTALECVIEYLDKGGHLS